jgi:hypothetical protein
VITAIILRLKVSTPRRADRPVARPVA